ncbi:phytanoyl-CoA dioxygenase family protein [Labrys wisconsinensis]|uniref:Ectoine hydroxylase-related dioxygenase (Phytanoyl-CoA dioxygenase family) n=1 Tax=Labrys wisconsinensis TaxID=425677 RepID=A0ABU0J315_9HYPH|nr:phytanoyl-CoA dioxygenase family protein [Labrys wisconsinensis]MDQ0468656.1 ectoine hydroxylase-related dioxygenase (phytanoyl-CoA dioxygenase family) [Labrys wisconsinensis]
MYTRQAMRELGIPSSGLSAAQAAQLDEDGFFIVEGVLPDATVDRMRSEFERIHAVENDRGGHEVHVEPGARRISNIFNKTDAFDACLEIPEVLGAAHYLLGEIKVHGANLRDPVQGYGKQDLHVDVPKLFDDDWWVVNAMIMMDDMTPDNGPTRVVPGSHRWAPINVPYVNQGDWEPRPLSPAEAARVPEDLGAPYPGEVLVTAPAGSAIICNSSMWHAGTLKRSNTYRRMLHLTYTRRDLPQQLVQLDHLTPELYGRMSPVHRYLLEIEPPRSGDGVLRQPKREHRGWWN